MTHPPLTAVHDAVGDLFRRQLFFIGGAARSGTTWLQVMLNAHPGVSCRGEGHFCDTLLPLLDQSLSRYNGLVETKNTTLFRDLDPFPKLTSAHGQYLLAAAMALMLKETAGDTPIVGEKTPDNVLAVAKLRALFPAARFIFVLRDGRDCAVSAWFHNIRFDPDTMRKMFPSFGKFIDAFAPGWATCTDHALRYTAAYPRNCITVAYESLVCAPDATLARLFSFLGATTGAATLQNCIESGSFRRLSGGRAPGQEDRNSHFRRGEIGDWQNHFNTDMIAAFERHAGAQLQRCGYTRAPASTPAELHARA